MQFEEDQAYDPQQDEAEEGIISHSFPFEDDDIMPNVLDLEGVGHDNHKHDIEI